MNCLKIQFYPIEVFYNMPINYNSYRVIAIIPVYNEIGKIGNVVSKFSKKFVDEVCLILDEPTHFIKTEIKKSSENIDIPLNIIENGKRRGIGYAIRLGIKYAIKNNFDIIVVLAGNNKDDPREIPILLHQIIQNNYDYVQGARFLIGGKHKNTPILRLLIIKLYSIIWSLLTGILCTDVTNGFRAYKTEIFKEKQINIWQNWLNGYELEFYLHYKMLTLGYKTCEVPVSKIYPNTNLERYSHIHPIKDFWNIIKPIFFLTFGLRK